VVLDQRKQRAERIIRTHGQLHSIDDS
jgi:hypothetical protein